MKLQKIFTFILLVLITTSGAHSQDHFLKTNLVGPAFNRPFNLGFEINKKKPHSFVFTVEGGWYMRDKAQKFEQLYWKKRITGAGFIPEYRYYFNYRSRLNKPVGLFAGGYLVGRYLEYLQNYDSPAVPDVYEESFAYGCGALIGYKFKDPASKIYFEALLGVGLGYIEIANYESDFLPDQHLLSRFEISVGYTFQ